MSKIALHGYFNSSTSYRVRIALALKDVAYDALPVNLRTGEQRTHDYTALNPSAGVPVLQDGDITLSQSLAIIDYLDTKFPQPRLIPSDPLARARVLEFSLGIACDIHPVNNLRILQYLMREIGVSEAQKQAWYQHWVALGLAAAEQQLAQHGHGRFCFGDQPTLADCCLIPQIANARRMNCPLEAYPRLMAVDAHCTSLPTFQAAAPRNQTDFVEG